ncbi:MAG: hypothetical protein AB8F26_03585 [Phycisphaerales bacterium]
MKRIMMTCAVLFAGVCVGCSTTSKVDACCGACAAGESCTTGCCGDKAGCCGSCGGAEAASCCGSCGGEAAAHGHEHGEGHDH